MIKNFWQIFWRECRYMGNNKRLLVIMVVVPVVFVLLMGQVYSHKTIDHLRLGIINDSPSVSSRQLIEAFNKSPIFEISGTYDDEQAIDAAMMRGDIEGVLVIPESFTRDLERGQGTNVLLGANGSNMSISSTIMARGSEIVSTVSTQIAVKNLVAGGATVDQAYSTMLPIAFDIRPWYNPTVNYSHFLLLGYVTAIVQQVTIYFAALAMVREKKEGTWSQLLAISHSSIATILGKMLPYLLLGMLGWSLAYSVCIFGYGTPMQGQWWVWAVFSTIFFFSFCSIGIFISCITHSKMEATQLAMIVAMPAFLLSGYTWPIMAMNSLYQALVHIWPLTFFSVNIRNIALMGTSFNDLQIAMLVLSAIGCTFTTLSMLVYHHQRQRTTTVEPQRTGEAA